MKMKHPTQARKQSIIAGGLISSAGIFIAKFLGLFYAVPFNTILESSSNIAIYGVAFNIYSYVLNVCTAGFPFAIATMIAKYSSRGDYQTSLLIKKLSSNLMISLGLIAMLFLLLFATPLAPLVIPQDANDVTSMRNVLMMISAALFFVPILSSMRGFYQGLKHMEVYALSQVLEQIARIAFLLITSAAAVYIFQANRVWAVYFGAMSTTVAAILAIIHLKLYDRKQMVEIKKLAKVQAVEPNKEKGVILKELIFIAFPYFIVAILGYSDTIINTIFVNNGLQKHYLQLDQVQQLGQARMNEITTIIAAINYGVLKLMSIPMILAPGFSSAIIPHITSALVTKDDKLVQKNIRDCIDIVLYIGMPISFCLFVFAKPLYSVLFYPGSDEQLALCAQVLSWFSIEAFLSTLGPIFTSLMMAVGLRRLNIRNLIIMVSLKFMITYPFLVWLGYPGLIFSSLIAMGIFITLDAFALTTRFHVLWSYTLHKICIILLGLAVIYVVGYTCDAIGLKGYGQGRMLGLVQLAMSGSLSMLAYFMVTYFFGIPQAVLHIDFKKFRKKGKH